MSITVSSATNDEIIALKQGIDYVVSKNQGTGSDNTIAAAAITLQATILAQYNTQASSFTEPANNIVDPFE